MQISYAIDTLPSGKIGRDEGAYIFDRADSIMARSSLDGEPNVSRVREVRLSEWTIKKMRNEFRKNDEQRLLR